MKTVYIVSGVPRSGTSMMMLALMTGGMEGIYSEEAEERLRGNLNKKDYVANPNGFWEMGRNFPLAKNFPEGFEDKVVKRLHPGILKIPQVDGYQYKIIFMFRAPEEAEQSLKHLRENRHMTADEYKQTVARTFTMLAAREDVQINPVFYPRLVQNPMEAFGRIRDLGWPIDVSLASSVVDPKLYRYRKETI